MPKNSADSGQTTYVQPPLAGLFCRVAVNSLSIMVASWSYLSVRADAAARQG